MQSKLKFVFLMLAMVFISVSFTGAYFSDGVTISGNSFTTGTWEVPAAKVVISEVFYNATGGVNDTGLEWIEIANTGGQQINLAGYDLYLDGAGYYFTFPSVLIKPNKIILVHLNLDGVDTETDLYTGGGHSNMNNSNGSIALFKTSVHSSSTIIDYIRFGTNTSLQSTAVGAGIWTSGATIPSVGAGHSIELIDKIDNNSVGDWRDQSVPTPGV